MGHISQGGGMATNPKEGTEPEAAGLVGGDRTIEQESEDDEGV